MKFFLICFLIGFVFVNVASLNPDSTLPDKDLLENLKSPALNPFKLSTLVIPKLKGHEIEIVEEKVENALIYGFSTAELKSYNLNPTDSSFDIEILIRNLTLDYDVTFKGKIHSEDIDFKGHGHQILENSDIKTKAKFEIFEQEGKQHIKLLDSTTHWTPGRIVAIGLTDENGKSDEHLTKLISDHWTDILKDEEHDFDDILHDIFSNEVNAALSKLPLT